MNSNIKQLMALMEQYPELPIAPMVSGEMCDDDICARFLGQIGYCRVDRYIVGKKRFYLYDDTDMQEVIEVLEDVADFIDDGSATDEELITVYRELPWVKAILVDIDSL